MMEALAFALAVGLIYWPCRYGAFFFDDLAILHDTNVKTRNFRNILKHRAWRRLTALSYATNVWLTGWVADTSRQPDAWTRFGFHAGNVALHLLNSFLVWALFSYLTPLAWLGAFLYAVHPLNSQGVAYISGRSSVLAATFIYMALIAMFAGYAIPAVILMGVACLAKQDSAVNFGLLAAAGFIYSVPGWAMALVVPACGLAYYWKSFRHLLTRTGDTGMQDAGFPATLKTPVYQITAFTESLRRLPLWVIGAGYNADHRMTVHGWRSPLFWFTIACLCGSIWDLSPFPVFLLTFLMIIVPMVPYWIFPIPDPVAENRMTVCVAGIALFLTTLPAVVLAPMIVVFMVHTATRAWYWSDEVSLWNSVLWGGGRTDRAYINLARKAIEDNDAASARQHAAEALAVNPNLAIARYNLALLDNREGKLADAIAGYQETVDRSPRYYQGWYGLGCVLETAGRRAEAVAAHIKAVELSKWAPSVNRLGMVAVLTNHLPEAERYFRTAIKDEPCSIDYAHNLAWSMMLQGKKEEAVSLFKQMPKQYVISTEMLNVKREAR